MLKARLILLLGVVFAFAFLPIKTAGAPQASVSFVPPCENPGWFPSEFGLKDHHVFWYDGYYYLVSIHVEVDSEFVYGRSTDLCEWETLAPVLSKGEPGGWDEMAIWAPFVYSENGVYYMYYTGVTYDFTQSIMLATTTDPSDPESWQPQGMIFQPNHPGMEWPVGYWADCRDPTMVKVGDLYYLYYTGRDVGGGIVGLATATSPTGPWTDWGAIVGPISDAVLESPTIVQYDSAYYLFYHHTTLTEYLRMRDRVAGAPRSLPGFSLDGTLGEFYRIGASPGGPWQAPLPFFPGWAHEVWQSVDGDWFTSYLSSYTVTIAPVIWDARYSPPRPAIDTDIYRMMMPLIKLDPDYPPRATVERTVPKVFAARFEPLEITFGTVLPQFDMSNYPPRAIVKGNGR